MEKMARVPLKNGNWKYFYGDNAEKEANAYEVELKQREIEEKERQKIAQEERAKAVAKAEEEKKAKEEVKRKRLKEVTYAVDFVNSAVEKYKKETGEKLEYVTVNGKLETRKCGLIGMFEGIPIFIR